MQSGRGKSLSGSCKLVTYNSCVWGVPPPKKKTYIRVLSDSSAPFSMHAQSSSDFIPSYPDLKRSS